MAPSPSRMARGGTQFIALTLSVATSATILRSARRRGAPLLRPLARLTAFGGYVATGAPSWRWRPRHRAWHGEGRNSLRPPRMGNGRDALLLVRCYDAAFGRDKRDPPARRSTARHDCGGHEKYDGGAHPSCDRLRGSLRSGDMSLRGCFRGDGALAIVPAPPRLLVFVV